LAITRHETWRSEEDRGCFANEEQNDSKYIMRCSLVHVTATTFYMLTAIFPFLWSYPCKLFAILCPLLAFSLIFIIVKPQWLINSIYSSPTFKVVNISGNFIDIYRVCVCVCVCFVRFVKDIYDYVISKC
jgi:uncharacterized membrane protein